jgi:hypothetical protein
VFEDALGVPQGWAQVPRAQHLFCWCTNGVGTFANESTGCTPEPCPYPPRCVDRLDGVPNNGTTCVEGSTGLACVRCSRRWYRYRDDCLPCPIGVPKSVILLGVFAGVFLLYVGPALSRLASPQAVALLRSLVMYMQYLALR